LWSATQFTNDDVGDYWTRIGLLAGAGLVMGLSQLPGGWTRSRFPRLSIPVLVLAFVPVAVVSRGVILAGEPGAGSFHNHVRSWTLDIHISRLVAEMFHYVSVLAFGTGLVLGCSFDIIGAPQTADRETTVDEPEADVTPA